MTAWTYLATAAILVIVLSDGLQLYGRRHGFRNARLQRFLAGPSEQQPSPGRFLAGAGGPLLVSVSLLATSFHRAPDWLSAMLLILIVITAVTLIGNFVAEER